MSERVSLDEKYFSGGHEIEESESEADLYRNFSACRKNPGHVNFIPVRTFDVKHLPEGYRDAGLRDLVKCLAAQTVRVEVKVTSLHRPEIDTATGLRYPFYDSRGTRRVRYGTGRIRRVAQFDKGIDKYGQRHPHFSTCPCWECKTSPGKQKDIWWEIQIITAKHVVFDNHEAEKASCDLFYDDEDDVIGRDVVKGIGAVYHDEMRDTCEMICVTCNQTLADRLNGVMNEYDRLWPAVHARYKDRRYDDRLTFIVSHPHGVAKRISVGRWLQRFTVDGSQNVSRFSYSNSTCPGSSGALVYILGLVCKRLYYHHAHSYASGVGYSGIGEEEYVDDTLTFNNDIQTFNNDIQTFNNDIQTFNNDIQTFNNDIQTFNNDIQTSFKHLTRHSNI